MRRLYIKFRGVRTPLWALVCVCLLISFGLLLSVHNKDSRYNESHSSLKTNSPHERKPLDYSDSLQNTDVLKFQINEMKQIKLSVLNELRQLEQERADLRSNLQSEKDNLVSVQKQLSTVKTDLAAAKSKLARNQHNINGKQSRNWSPQTVSSAPVVIVNIPTEEVDTKIIRRKTSTQNKACTFEECFDYLRCPLSKPFTVFFYNLQSEINRQFLNQELGLTDTVREIITEKHSLTQDASTACIFLLVTDVQAELEEKLRSLPHWGSEGANHIILNPFNADPSFTQDKLTSRAVYASMYPVRPSFGIVLVPVLLDSKNDLWKGLPSHLPAFRPVLLYFEGELGDNVDSSLGYSEVWVPGAVIEELQRAISAKTSDRVQIETSCKHKMTAAVNMHSDRLGEWKLCRSIRERTESVSKSTFSLILGSKTGLASSATLTRLTESLQNGAIPVIINVNSLPFESVIDWKKAVLFVPVSRIGELHYILRSIQPDTILEYRRQGSFLWKTYFSSRSTVVETVLAIMRFRANHPPPSAKDFNTAKTLIQASGSSLPVASAIHQQNTTIYTREFWNSPPGPFYMYPLTPFTSGPVSGSQYVGLSETDVSHLPSHIIQAGGITGPYFQDYLLGNRPVEQFTVVMLTYERENVLMEAISRLDDLDGLAKVVVMWNSPTLPSEDIKWPSIQAALEVVSVGKNSLNNRFLPLENIQTEAVLSLDDDVHLRHDEIQFAFRVWREARDRIVGFPGRFHAWDVRHSSWLYNSNYTCELSMVLTGAAFIHKYYLYLYSQWMPSAIREMVDEYTNCEDIAMNFLVSHITRKPPLKVTSRWTFRCPGCPENLSSNNEHFNERHVCMNRLVEVYGYMPLLYTQFRLDSVLFKTRLPSHLDKCYQYV